MNDYSTTTIHVHKTDAPFAMVPKALLSDDRLSWKAKGILAYLIGKPNDWKVRVSDLVKKSTDGITSVRTGLLELRKTGYGQLECIRYKGRISQWIWHISDQPQFVNKNASPESGFPQQDKPKQEKLKQENRTLPITTITKKENTNNNTTRTGATAPSVGGGDLPLGATAPKASDAGASEEKPDPGKLFLEFWEYGYEKWFKVPYIGKPGEKALAARILQKLKCRPIDLATYAYRMWVNTTDYDVPRPEGFDPRFWQIKGSRSARFFLDHLAEIANEQKEPFEIGLPVNPEEYITLLEAINSGRPEA